MWKGRKSAFAAVGRISPSYLVEDGVIPRSEIARVLREIERMAREVGLRVANVFHAGDGNLHPLVLYDAREPGRGGARGAARRRDPAALHPLRRAPSPASTASAPRRRSTWPSSSRRTTSRPWQRVRCAFDGLALMNPGKVFPTPRLCGEKPGPLPPAPGRGRGARGALVMRPRPARRRAARRRARRPPAARRRARHASTRRRRRCARSPRDRLAVAFVGGGTDLELGAPPARLDAVLRTTGGSRASASTPPPTRSSRSRRG